jgi:serine/threonine-protein kinase
MKLERIGKYEILGEIGRGTMGTVYKAKDPVLNRFVAIKTMVATPGRNDESKQRFQREAQAAALLSHPNIVTVHDLGEEQGLIYMAMELLEGEDLRDVIGTDRVASLDDKLHVMEQIASGLAFAHSKKVVHRDLKPANIHLQPNGQVKIVDFGLARLGGSDMTQTGVVLGTPNYMSPEQALGDRVDSRTDVFSAGGVFYELLTGKKPFDAETTPGVLYQVVHKEPIPIRKWTPDVPPILVEVVERCLAKDKNLRFQDGRQMRAALGVVRQALEGGRADTAVLAEESQRANLDGRKDSSQRLSPAASQPPWVEGNVALASPPAPEPSSSSGRRTATTLSGRAPTQPSASRPPRPAPRSSSGPIVVGSVLLLAAAGGGYWYWTQLPERRASAPPETTLPSESARAAEASRAEVGALTEALVDSQIELALKNLEDKNWAGAISQAERALKLQPESARAREILEQARGRRGELDAAATEARRAFEAGNLQEASRALDRVLELDPKHAVVGELTTRLNSQFRSRAEDARRLALRARSEAERSKATGLDGFSEALARTAEGDVLFRKSEFADATQRFLEARDSFDRVRRTALAAARPSGPAPGPPVAERPVPIPTATAVATAPTPPAPSSPTAAVLLPTRRFVTGKSVVASAKSGGGVPGFDDVKSQKVPDLVGRLDFEVEPAAPQEGDGFVVRVYLINEGRRAVRVRGVTLTALLNQQRTSLGGTLREREVVPQQRGLVAEARGIWPGGLTSWSLEAVLSSDRDETCTGRLEWK